MLGEGQDMRRAGDAILYVHLVRNKTFVTQIPAIGRRLFGGRVVALVPDIAPPQNPARWGNM
jgi:hypothetical protein